MDRTHAQEPEGAVVRADFGHSPTAREALVSALWRERELLDHLLFALTSQQLILEARMLRWLPTSTDQVGAAVEALREHEVVRAAMAEGLAAEVGLPLNTCLADLAVGIGDPHRAILLDLAGSLRDSATAVDSGIRRNDELLLALVGPPVSDGDAPSAGIAVGTTG